MKVFIIYIKKYHKQGILNVIKDKNPNSNMQNIYTDGEKENFNGKAGS